MVGEAKSQPGACTVIDRLPPHHGVAGRREAALEVGCVVVAVLAAAAFSWCSSLVMDVLVTLQRQVPAVPLR